jgi:hypothetical protein
MTLAEAVKLAAKTVGGKNGEAFVPPVSGIVYSTPEMNSFQGSAKEKRIFADISLKDVIEKAKTELPEQPTIEKHKEVAEEVENIIRNFSAKRRIILRPKIMKIKILLNLVYLFSLLNKNKTKMVFLYYQEF